MKKEYGEEDFLTVMDDSNWYQGIALELLDSLNIKTIWANKPFIKLVGKRETWALSLKRKGLPEWNMIYFKRNKEPSIISTPDVTTQQINDYFKNENRKRSH